MKRICIFILFLNPFVPANAQDTVKYSLQQCIDIAIRNSMTMASAEAQAGIGKARLNQAEASLFPSVSGYANQGINQGKSINPYTNSYINQEIITGQYGLNAGMTLFNGLSLINNLRQSSLNYKAGNMDAEQAKLDLTISVVLAYLQVLSTAEQVKQATAQLEASLKQTERLKTLESNQAISPAVFYDTRGQLAGDKLTLINLKAANYAARTTLSQLMNVYLPEQVSFEPAGNEADLKPYTQPRNEIRAQALANMPLMKAARYRQSAYRKGLYAARGQLFPTVSLVGSLGTNYSNAALTQQITGSSDVATNSYVVYNNNPLTVYTPQYQVDSRKIPFNTQFHNNLNSYVGLSLQFTLFNGLRGKTQLDIAHINKQLADRQLHAAENRMQSTIDQVYNDMTASYERYIVLQQQAEDYAASYRIATGKFENGSITTVEYITAKTNADKAHMNLIAARYDYILKQKILDYYNLK